MNYFKAISLAFFLLFTISISKAQQAALKTTKKDLIDTKNYEDAKKLIEEQKNKEGLLKLEESLAKSPNDYNKIKVVTKEVLMNNFGYIQ